MKIMIINGPNLNKLGKREPDIYGSETISDIEQWTKNKTTSDIKTDWRLSNHEGEIIDWIQACENEQYTGLIINPGGYSHSSVAIFDALKTITCPKIEVHLSQVFQREEFRHKMLTAGAADYVLTGLGKASYFYALEILKEKRK